MRLIENFLPKEIFLDIQKFMLNSMPWYYSHHTTLGSKKQDDFFFYHNLYIDGNQQSPLFEQLIHPILGRLEFNYLYRARARLVTRQPTQIPHNFHVDDEKNHTVALFSVNTNNGYTLFENGEKAYSKENTILVFDGSLEHATVPQTDTNMRVNINLNFG